MIPLTVFDPATGKAATINAELDTGNDHTIIRRDVLNTTGVSVIGTKLSINGVTGSSLADRAIFNILIRMDDGHECNIHNHEVGIADDLSVTALLGRDFLQWFDVKAARSGTVTLEL